MCTINGQLRPVPVRDRSVESDAPAAEKADPAVPGHVAAPFGGSVTPVVEVGAQVAAGDTVAKIEAMKMEASITAPVAGTVDPHRPGRHRPGGRRRPHHGDRLAGGVPVASLHGRVPNDGRPSCSGRIR